jgi:hypothetical protein
MSEELLGGSQTTPETQTQEPTIQEQPQTQEPAVTQDQFFEVKYNKEPMKIGYDQAPEYIEKGLNYDKVKSRATEYENHLNRVAQLSGYQSHDEFIQALDEAEKQQERQRYEEAGINPDLFNQLLETHPDMQYAREMRAREQEQQQLSTEVNQLREQFPDLKPDDLTDELFQVKAEKNIPLLHAYLELNYTKLAQQKEQEAIQKLTQNAQSTPGSLGAGAEHKTGYSNLSEADKKALRDRVLRGETIQL